MWVFQALYAGSTFHALVVIKNHRTAFICARASGIAFDSLRDSPRHCARHDRFISQELMVG